MFSNTVIDNKNSKIYHSYGEVPLRNLYEGKPNIKYVSSSGSFEIVFNANREVQTSLNNPDDMGTYNYYNPRGIDSVLHGISDVAPYKRYGNTKEVTS